MKNDLKNLFALYKKITSSETQFIGKYFVPKLWIEPFSNSNEIADINPFEFFKSRIEAIFDAPRGDLPNDENLIVYSLLPRYSSAFDHNLDGKISLSAIDGKFFETGTFLKTIALLPYYKSFGVNCLYFLPLTEIGKHSKKGILGSPYAINNHFRFDSRLSEPFFEESLDLQFKALVEACHHLGIRVVVEFVLRTVSVDCDLALEHPEWFYWIYDDCEQRTFKPPYFSPEELIKIETKVKNGDFENLPPPPPEYIKLFSDPPKIVKREGEKIVGINTKGQKLKIPNAFADWPPNDTQPLWFDVTYLKYYDHPKYNYIAYNTVRMYEQELAKKSCKNHKLWEYLENIIPHYIENYDIDGVMIDMGHAMPISLLRKIINKARRIKEDFIFWEENFNVEEKSKQLGYNATLGYLPFDQHDPVKLNELLMKFQNRVFPLPFFLASESHNTPRSARFGCKFNQLVWGFNSFLDGIRFLLSGFELCDSKPWNTGLCFTPEEIEKYPPERLSLFSPLALDWGKSHILEFIRQVNHLRSYIRPRSLKLNVVQTGNQEVVGYSLSSADELMLIVLGNFSNLPQKISLQSEFPDLWDYFTRQQCELTAKPLLFDEYELKIFVNEEIFKQL